MLESVYFLKASAGKHDRVGKVSSQSFAFSGILPPSIMNCSVSAGIQLGPGISYVT